MLSLKVGFPLLKLSGEITRQNKVWYLLIHIFERLFSECNKYKKLSVFTNCQKCPKYKRLQYSGYMEVIVLSGTEIILILWACTIHTRKTHASVRTNRGNKTICCFLRLQIHCFCQFSFLRNTIYLQADENLYDPSAADDASTILSCQLVAQHTNSID